LHRRANRGEAILRAIASRQAPRTTGPWSGLERLRELIFAIGQVEGVKVAGDIGVTSNTGDLLRRAAIPSQLAAQLAPTVLPAEARNQP
jgi:hypothetical protein